MSNLRKDNRRQPRKRKSAGVDLASVFSVALPEGQTDIANARRLVEMHGDKVRYCHPWKKWLVWDSQRWKPEDDGATIRLAKSVADAVWKDALFLDDNQARKFAASTASEKHVRAMLNLAASEVPIQPDDMDAHPWLLKLSQWHGRPADRQTARTSPAKIRSRKFVRQTSNQTQGPYTWDRFLEGVFDGDGELIDFVQRLFGYMLTGDVREQVLPIFWGDGANGKSTLLNAFLHAFGTDYAMQAIPRHVDGSNGTILTIRNVPTCFVNGSSPPWKRSRIGVWPKAWLSN